MKILGTGSSLPTMQVSNDDLSKFLDTNDEWIFPRTGIKSRHIISSEKLEDLALDAARKALDNAGVDAGELDMLICSNVVNEFITPSLSCIVASKLGISCPCFDINCACPGFIYAMDMADSYFRSGKVKKVLIVCAEEPTRMIDWSDRSTCVLFGDGAGAAVFGEGDNLRGTRLSAQPDPDKLYEIHKLQPTPYITKEEADVPLVMKGREVFNDTSGQPAHHRRHTRASGCGPRKIPHQHTRPRQFFFRILPHPARRVQQGRYVQEGRYSGIQRFRSRSSERYGRIGVVRRKLLLYLHDIITDHERT